MDDIWLAAQTVGGIAGVYAFLRWYEPRMIYHPRYPSRQLEQTPAHDGMVFEDINLTARDGTRLSSWFLPALPDKANGLTICFFHGNAGNISHRVGKARILLELGFAVFLLDYRGFGQSEGKPSEAGTYADANAAYQYLTHARGISPSHLVLYGESLGTAIATDLAARLPIAGLVLEAGFTSIADAGQRIFWFLPIRFLVRNRYETRRKIGKIRVPLLMLHSRNDEFFRFARHARPLFAAAPQPKELVEMQGQHANAFFQSESLCRAALRQFADLVRETGKKLPTSQ